MGLGDWTGNPRVVALAAGRNLKPSQDNHSYDKASGQSPDADACCNPARTESSAAPDVFFDIRTL